MIIILLILGVMFGPPVLMVIYGIKTGKTDPQRAKVFYIFAAVYLVIGVGSCLTLLSSF